MKKQILLFFIIGFSLFVLLGCTKNNNQIQSKNSDQLNTTQNRNSVEENNINSSTDNDGFVRMPGEPSRGDSAYYITGEICQQFTKEFMEGILGKKIYQAAPTYTELTNCQYEVDENGANILLSLSFLPVENQIKGHKMMERKVEANNSIPMDNFVVTQENGLINEIYLVLSPNKFLSINRSSQKALSEQEVLTLAQKLGEKIKKFK